MGGLVADGADIVQGGGLGSEGTDLVGPSCDGREVAGGVIGKEGAELGENGGVEVDLGDGCYDFVSKGEEVKFAHI